MVKQTTVVNQAVTAQMIHGWTRIKARDGRYPEGRSRANPANLKPLIPQFCHSCKGTHAYFDRAARRFENFS
jgi:hypothetical protein